MNISPVLRRLVTILAMLTLSAAPLAAQNILFADLDGKFYPVLKAQGNKAYVMVKDQLLAADGSSFALNPGKSYLPVFVSVRDLRVETAYLNTTTGSTLNNEFHFQATLKTPYRLEDVFIVLELVPENTDKTIFLQEVGPMNPRELKNVSVRVPLSSNLGRGRYHFYLFSQGIEVLQSEIPAPKRDEAVDRMIAARLPAGPEAAPQIFIGPEPEYPPELRKAQTKGQAVISIRIGANGRVYDPAVKSATDPAFGEAALEAVRLWRFMPRVKGGRPVEAKVDVPINFTPPEIKP
jgi:TonB family protein